MRLPSTCLTALLSVLLAAPALAQAAGTPLAYDVRQYGAKGDGKTLDTDAINQAIGAADAAGGGTVVFHAGTYLCASIHLRSNITLLLESGSTIEAVDPSVHEYDLPEPNEWGDTYHYQDYGHSHWHNSLIWGVGLHDVAIVGPGLIHGKGLNNGLNTLLGSYKDGGAGNGNKAIALRDCRNVLMRDFGILHGGHFGILATGVDNLTIDNLRIDTNRDGMDIDCCRNVRVSNCSVNSPWDDGICLKASYGLGALRACNNITITNCYVTAGYEEGSLLDASYKPISAASHPYHNGRIKLGTESNGDFKNIAISNCVFEDCMGLAIESVDGSHIEDVAVSNLTMRHVWGAPVFIRLGNRARGPNHPPVGTIRRVSIDNVVASDSDGRYSTIVSGIPGHPVEDLRISNLRARHSGGGTRQTAAIEPPENEDKYPEPSMFGEMPAYGFFLRHVDGLEMNHVKVDTATADARPAFVLEDVRDAAFDHIDAATAAGVAVFDLRHVAGFVVTESRGVADTRAPAPLERATY